MSGEVIDVGESTVAALVPVPSQAGALVRPAASVADIEAAFTAYSQLCNSLLDSSDYQRIGDKDFPKKSAWRKLAVAFGVSSELVSRDYERDQRGRIIRAEILVRATAPNGRHMDGLGVCDLLEKCCQQGCRKRHTHCAADCDGARHFSNPQHDLPATAMTRATNRACSDLFGMGEVSAEEIVGDGHEDGHGSPTAAPVGDIAAMRPRDVRDALEARGLPLGGTPDEMRQRLAEAIAKEAPVTDAPIAEPSAPEGADGAAEPDAVPDTRRPDAPGPAASIDPKVLERLQLRIDQLPDDNRRNLQDVLVTMTDGRYPNELLADDVLDVSQVISDAETSVKPGAALAARAARHDKAAVAS